MNELSSIKVPTRRRIRTSSWVIGSFSVAASIGMYGYVSHARGVNQEEISKLQMAAQLVMMNGVGMCLISKKKKTNFVLLPFICLLVSSGIGFGQIPLSKMDESQRSQMKWMNSFGLGTAAIGWIALLAC